MILKLLKYRLEDAMIFSYSEEDKGVQVKVDDASYLDDIASLLRKRKKNKSHFV